MKVKNIMFSGFAAAIFAGVCGAADAAVSAVSYELTSREYVDAEVAKKQNKLTVTGDVLTWDAENSTLGLTGIATSDSLETLQNTVNTLSADVNTDGSVKKQIADAIADEVERADDAYDAAGSAAAAQAAAEATADAALTAYKTANDAKVNKNTEDIASINAELDTMATSETVTNLTTRVATAEGEIDALQTADTTIRSEFAAADAATLQSAKDYADANDADTIYDDTQVKADIASINTELEKKQNNLTVTGGVLTWDAETSTLGLTGIATSDSLDTLQNTVNTLSADANTDGSVKKQIADAIASEVERADDAYDAAGSAAAAQAAAEAKVTELANGAVKDNTDAIAENTQAIADEKTAREQADETLKGMIEDGDFVSASGILATKGGYLVYSDGAGNITLNQVAVVNGDGTTDIITGESLQ